MSVSKTQDIEYCYWHSKVINIFIIIYFMVMPLKKAHKMLKIYPFFLFKTFSDSEFKALHYIQISFYSNEKEKIEE